MTVPDLPPPSPLDEPRTQAAVPARPARALVTLRDAWPWARPFRLDGPAERGGFTPVWSAVLWLVGAFLLYQLVGAFAMVIGLVAEATASGAELDPFALMEGLADQSGVLLGGNAIGQVFGFGLVALLAARLHTRQWPAFLRLGRGEAAGFALAVGGWMGLVLPVQWAGNLNRTLPLPPWLEEMETMQTDLIERALLGSDLGVPFLLATMALTPALCEELLFRGYLQRQVERRTGGLAAAVLVGLVFGLYHLRLTQLAPLVMLGVYLGFVVWATGSLWTGVLVHFANNALAVGAADWARRQPDLDPAALETLPVPWYLALGSLVVTLAAGALMLRLREARTGGRPDAAVVPEEAPASPVPLSLPVSDPPP